MRWLELFAGAGGAALGIRDAGGDAVACVEWAADAAATLEAAGFPAVHADVRRVVADYDPRTGLVGGMWSALCDAMWASFPCQAWSTAGKRLGAEDERNGWPWTLDAIDVVSPKWFVAENVPGLTMHSGECEDGCTGTCAHAYLHGTILRDLRSRYLYVQHAILDAADYGVPQFRRRVFIVAGPRPIRWPAPTHGDPSQLSLFNPLKPWVTFSEALGLHEVQDPGPQMHLSQSQRVLRPGQPSTTVDGGTSTGSYRSLCVLDGSRNSEANPGQEKGSTSDMPAPDGGGRGNQMLRIIGGGRNPQAAGIERTYRDLTNEPSTTVPAVQVGNAGPWVCEPGAAAELLNRPSVTVTTTDGVGIGSAASRDQVEVATGKRRLTWRECATLQGFPPDHPFQGSTKASIYRQVGNAVPPRLAEVVVRAVHEADR